MACMTDDIFFEQFKKMIILHGLSLYIVRA